MISSMTTWISWLLLNKTSFLFGETLEHFRLYLNLITQHCSLGKNLGHLSFARIFEGRYSCSSSPHISWSLTNRDEVTRYQKNEDSNISFIDGTLLRKWTYVCGQICACMVSFLSSPHLANHKIYYHPWESWVSEYDPQESIPFCHGIWGWDSGRQVCLGSSILLSHPAGFIPSLKEPDLSHPHACPPLLCGGDSHCNIPYLLINMRTGEQAHQQNEFQFLGAWMCFLVCLHC